MRPIDADRLKNEWPKSEDWIQIARFWEIVDAQPTMHIKPKQDRYGYIAIEDLLNYCANQKDHTIDPNDFMRMPRYSVKQLGEGGEEAGWQWIRRGSARNLVCPLCGSYFREPIGKQFKYCPNCGEKLK